MDNISSTLHALVTFGTFAGCLVSLYVALWIPERDRLSLLNWAKSKRWRLIQCEWCSMERGAHVFFVGARRIYQVAVIDDSGRYRIGNAAFESWLSSSEVEVTWVEEYGTVTSYYRMNGA